MARVRFGLLKIGVRTSFVWVESLVLRFGFKCLKFRVKVF